MMNGISDVHVQRHRQAHTQLRETVASVHDQIASLGHPPDSLVLVKSMLYETASAIGKSCDFLQAQMGQGAGTVQARLVADQTMMDRAMGDIHAQISRLDVSCPLRQNLERVHATLQASVCVSLQQSVNFLCAGEAQDYPKAPVFVDRHAPSAEALAELSKPLAGTHIPMIHVLPATLHAFAVISEPYTDVNCVGYAFGRDEFVGTETVRVGDYPLAAGPAPEVGRTKLAFYFSGSNALDMASLTAALTEVEAQIPNGDVAGFRAGLLDHLVLSGVVSAGPEHHMQTDEIVDHVAAFCRDQGMDVPPSYPRGNDVVYGVTNALERCHTETLAHVAVQDGGDPTQYRNKLGNDGPVIMNDPEQLVGGTYRRVEYRYLV